MILHFVQAPQLGFAGAYRHRGRRCHRVGLETYQAAGIITSRMHLMMNFMVERELNGYLALLLKRREAMIVATTASTT